MAQAQRERRKRKRTSYLSDIEGDFQDIEDNFATDFTRENPKTVHPKKSKAPSDQSLEVIKETYEKKLKALEEENKLLKESRESLTKNENKILSAIRSEKLIQKKERPIIGRTKFLRSYGLNSKFLDDAIKGLIQKEIVKREFVNYSPNIKTSQWEILVK